jgi:hypothetical protein
VFFVDRKVFFVDWKVFSVDRKVFSVDQLSNGKQIQKSLESDFPESEFQKTNMDSSEIGDQTGNKSM